MLILNCLFFQKMELQTTGLALSIPMQEWQCRGLLLVGKFLVQAYKKLQETLQKFLAR